MPGFNSSLLNAYPSQQVSQGSSPPTPAKIQGTKSLPPAEPLRAAPGSVSVLHGSRQPIPTTSTDAARLQGTRGQGSSEPLAPDARACRTDHVPLGSPWGVEKDQGKFQVDISHLKFNEANLKYL